MGVFNGQAVSAEITNPAFLDANADDVALGIIGFHNTAPASGGFIDNIQRATNTIFTTTGATEITPGTSYGAPASTITDGTSHLVALTALANKFHPTTGHKHSGASGDAPPVVASDLALVPLRGYFNQGTDLSAVTGSSVIVTSQLSGKTPSSGATNPGVVVTTIYNQVPLRYASGTNTNDQILDSLGNIVYGRLTYSFVSYDFTLSFYVLIGSAETAYSFVSATDIRWYYQELYNPMLNPPVYSEIAVIPSDNTVADVPVATTTLYGKTVLSTTAGAAIASIGVAGTANGTVANADHSHEGVHSVGAYGVIGSAPMGDVLLEAGTAITLSYNSGRIKIDSQGAIGFQEVPGGVVDGTNATFGPLTYVPSNANSIVVFMDGIAIPKAQWSLSSNNIVFGGAYIPQPGQSIYVFYITTGATTSPPVASGVQYVEYRTLSSGEIAAKQLTLAHLPATAVNVMVDQVGGTAQVYAVDFTVSSNILSWNGLALDGFLSAGDILRVMYFS